jgi:hypothetical protein
MAGLYMTVPARPPACEEDSCDMPRHNICAASSTIQRFFIIPSCTPTPALHN